jgi:hypothetical protein
MPRETRTLQDLPQEIQDRLAKEQRKDAERRKDPKHLSVIDRLTRLEIVLDLDQPGGS